MKAQSWLRISRVSFRNTPFIAACASAIFSRLISRCMFDSEPCRSIICSLCPGRPNSVKERKSRSIDGLSRT